MGQAPTADRAILVITFFLTVFVDLVVAVNVGVILAVLHFLRRMAEAVVTSSMETGSLKQDLTALGLADLPPSVLVYEIDGPMFFGAVENFERALLHTTTDPQTLIIRLHRVPFMDITGIQTIEEVIVELLKRNVRVLLCEGNERVLSKLKNAGVLAKLGGDGYEAHFATALLRACPPTMLDACQSPPAVSP